MLFGKHNASAVSAVFCFPVGIMRSLRGQCGMLRVTLSYPPTFWGSKGHLCLRRCLSDGKELQVYYSFFSSTWSHSKATLAFFCLKFKMWLKTRTLGSRTRQLGTLDFLVCNSILWKHFGSSYEKFSIQPACGLSQPAHASAVEFVLPSSRNEHRCCFHCQNQKPRR